MKTPEEVMEILEAFDATGSRAAAELVGCDHKTVGHWVRARDHAGGGLPVHVRPRPPVDAFAAKIEEWVGRSRGKVRADVCHQKLVAMGYLASERTTRRAVADAKLRWRAEHGRRTQPWIPEPGLWMQWDYGDGPEIVGRRTVLFCARGWLEPLAGRDPARESCRSISASRCWTSARRRRTSPGSVIATSSWRGGPASALRPRGGS